MIWNGREWNNIELLKKYKKNSSIILDFKLAIEDYEDKNNINISEFKQLNSVWKHVKEELNNISDEELFEKSEQIIMEYRSLLNKIGEEKFIFYPDGGVEYKNN